MADVGVAEDGHVEAGEGGAEGVRLVVRAGLGRAGVGAASEEDAARVLEPPGETQ